MRSVLALALVNTGPATYMAQGQVAVRDVGTALALHEGFMDVLEEYRGHLDRTQFDVRALALEMAFEAPEVIAEWVQNNIALDIYDGVLRGAQGTLMARAGNAIDQAILLATILGEVGYDVEIAYAQLEPHVASALLTDSLRRSRPSLPIGDVDAIERTFESAAELLGIEAPDVDAGGFAPLSETQAFRSAVGDVAWLTDELARAGVSLAESHGEDQLLVEARAYYWVQYRASSTHDWRAAHPAMRDASALQDLEPEATYAGAIPQHLQHRVRVQAMIERRIGDRLEVVPIMAPWEVPTANLSGQVITFSNMPDAIETLGDAADVQSVFESAQAFVPVLNGDLAPGALVFDYNGSTLPPEAAANPATGVFRTVGEGFEAAAGGLGGIGGSGDRREGSVRELTRQWLEYTLIRPGGAERTYRRSVYGSAPYDASEPAAASGPEVDRFAVAAALTASRSILVSTGPVPEAFTLDQKLGRILATQEFARGLVRGDWDESAASFEGGWLGLLDLMATIDDGLKELDPGGVQYRHEPAVVVHVQALDTLDRGIIQLDVVANPRRALAESPQGRVFSSPTQVVEAGVWETYVESIVLAGRQGAPAAISAPALVAGARDARTPMTVLYGTEQEPPAYLSAEAEAAVRQDLAAGYAVVLPRQAPPAADSDDRASVSAWWRVDPETGETLGMLGDGRGGLTEYMVVNIVLWGAAIVGVTAFFGCAGRPEVLPNVSGGKIVGCGLCGLMAGALAGVALGVAFGMFPGTVAVGGVTVTGLTKWGELTLALVAAACNVLAAFGS